MGSIDDSPVTGVITPTITFFDQNGNISPEANQLLIQHAILNRADCLFVLGSTGEGRFFCDKPDQKRKYLELVKATIAPSSNPDIPLVVGAYGENVEEAIRDCQRILQIVPDAGLVIPPPTQRKLSSQEQRDFFGGILEAINAPIYAYNNPGSFGGTNIDEKIMDGLKSFPQFKGLKDSSGSTEQKKIYLSLMSPTYTISCGKEGMLAQFLAMVPTSQRKFIGIVPSIANLTQTCGQIVELGNLGQDEKMIGMQNVMNGYREKIYDSKLESGKAQRGLKIAFAHLYANRGITIPTTVWGKLAREIPAADKLAIESQTDLLVKECHIKVLPA